MKHHFKKTIIIASICTTALTPAATLTACSAPENPVETTAGIFSEKSVLNFEEIKNVDKLNSDMSAGKTPVSCDVLYDQMGARPNVNVTDPDTIKKIYEKLGDITVTGKSNMSITDSYHHVIFTLQDGTVVRFGFEGTGMLSVGTDNYDVIGGSGLWSLVKEMQESAE